MRCREGDSSRLGVSSGSDSEEGASKTLVAQALKQQLSICSDMDVARRYYANK